MKKSFETPILQLIPLMDEVLTTSGEGVYNGDSGAGGNEFPWPGNG